MNVHLELLITGDSIDQRTPEEVRTTRPWNAEEATSVYKVSVEPGQKFYLGGYQYKLNEDTGKVELING